ncbi:MAG: hypothetical protein SPE49_00635 [Campylobacter sp.]|nr:hypothetical protein [Campylobacter sp.]MDY5114468.1 hypothetical protein [Campylobacter sp.]
MLEKLSYHTINNVEYITNITNELAEQGIVIDNENTRNSRIRT